MGNQKRNRKSRTLLEILSWRLATIVYDKSKVPETSFSKKYTYYYAIYAILSSTLTSASILALAIALGAFQHVVILGFIFIQHRTTHEGYHADKFYKCFLYSNIIFLVMVFLSNSIGNYAITCLIGFAGAKLLTKKEKNDENRNETK